MGLRYLLDTNVLSEPTKPSPLVPLLERLERSLDACATAAVVVHELEYGVLRLARSRRRDVLASYLEEVVSRLTIFSYDADAARWHARERARLARRGILPPFVDGQIAAVAAVQGLVLVTRNTRDYAAFEGLRVENWVG